MIAMTIAAITVMTIQGDGTVTKALVGAEAAETTNKNLRRQGSLRNFFNLTCKMSENRVQLASTFVLLKPCFFRA